MRETERYEIFFIWNEDGDGENEKRLKDLGCGCIPLPERLNHGPTHSHTGKHTEGKQNEWIKKRKKQNIYIYIS